LKRLISNILIALTAASTLATLRAEELRKAPELAINVPGQGQKLLSQLRGRVVALSFILTTCPHCQAEARLLTQLQAEYGPRGFQAVDAAINALDDNRTPEQGDALVTAFANNFHVGFPVGWVPRDSFLSFLGYSITEYTVVPQLVLIDRKGYIHYQTPARGDQTSLLEPTIRQRIQELLTAPDTAAVHKTNKTQTTR
jgi:thiol-disulfide isomerase/thioredoxin